MDIDIYIYIVVYSLHHHVWYIVKILNVQLDQPMYHMASSHLKALEFSVGTPC